MEKPYTASITTDKDTKRTAYHFECDTNVIGSNPKMMALQKRIQFENISMGDCMRILGEMCDLIDEGYHG